MNVIVAGFAGSKRIRAVCRALPCGAALLLLAPAPALAAPDVGFPGYDLAKSCAAIADKQGCVLLETQAKADLAARWPAAPKKKKARCREAGEQQGGSYVAALGCLDSE